IIVILSGKLVYGPLNSLSSGLDVVFSGKLVHGPLNSLSSGLDGLCLADSNPTLLRCLLSNNALWSLVK
ncbi:hypothetical protein U1Q18_036767, partial [Sarracenia purpurea var. burkii]